MPDIIDDLFLEHMDIVEALNEIKDLGIETAEARQKLLTLRGVLFYHLAKEDTYLYPFLLEVAENDENFKEALEFFIKDSVEKVSKIALNFFDKFLKENRWPTLKKDFKEFSDALKNRIEKEEAIIFEEYKKRKI